MLVVTPIKEPTRSAGKFRRRGAEKSAVTTTCAGPPFRTEGSEMTLIDQDMRNIIDSAKLAFVATVNPDGSPNLSPKGSVRVYDESHVAFMDIASPATIANLSVNPRIEIAVVDFLRRRGYRFSGTAEVHRPGTAVHSWLHQWLLGLNGPGYPAKQAVLLSVERVRPILSPAYTYGGTDEQTLVTQFTDTYLHGTHATDQPAGGPK
jgi:uncharacterized protein